MSFDIGATQPEREPAHAQVVPWEALLSPGSDQPFRVRLFDGDGFFVREANASEVEYTIAGPGGVTDDGLYTAPADAAHECALVTCKVGELAGQARVRIVPPLPWSFDFESVENVPLSWVGGRIRYNLREDDAGNHYIAKPTELPTRPGKPTTKLGTRSRMWMGPHTMSDYTVQADVQMQTGVAGEASADDPETVDTRRRGGRPGAALGGASQQPVHLCAQRPQQPSGSSTAGAPTTSGPSEGRHGIRAGRLVHDEDQGDARPGGGSRNRVGEGLAARRARAGRLDALDHRQGAQLPGQPRPVRRLEVGEFYVDNLTVTPN